MSNRAALTESSRWVIKVGTSLLTDSESGLNYAAIDSLVSQIVQLKALGVDVVLVSSGSIGEGMRRLGWVNRPGDVHKLQTAAAVGQMGLIQSYEAAFQKHNALTAQILLTHADLANRQRLPECQEHIERVIESWRGAHRQ